VAGTNDLGRCPQRQCKTPTLYKLSAFVHRHCID
jgi:hypothetical protein